ncbi:MAG: hypothetical protein ACOYYS_11305 [Chloroflexota bacterium]
MLTSPTQHFTIENFDDSLIIVIPHHGQRIKIATYSLLWSLVIVSLIVTFLVGYQSYRRVWQLLIAQDFFTFPYVIIFIIPFIAIAWSILEVVWRLYGKEVIEINKVSITIRHQLFSLELTSEHMADEIKGVFRSKQKDEWWYTGGSNSMSFGNFKRGKIAFNDGIHLTGDVKTFRFGLELDETDVRQIIGIIHKQFPQYQPAQDGTKKLVA